MPELFDGKDDRTAGVLNHIVESRVCKRIMISAVMRKSTGINKPVTIVLWSDQIKSAFERGGHIEENIRIKGHVCGAGFQNRDNANNHGDRALHQETDTRSSDNTGCAKANSESTCALVQLSICDRVSEVFHRDVIWMYLRVVLEGMVHAGKWDVNDFPKAELDEKLSIASI